MKVNIKYFGMIAEHTNCDSETVNLEVNNTLNLRDYFENRFSNINKFNYKIALNQQITDKLDLNLSECEIALLPPFAGG